MKAAAVLAVAGLAGLAGVGLAFGGTVVLRGGLAAAIAVQGAPFGCLLLLLAGHLIPERWSFKVERLVEAGALTMPVVGLAFVPPLLGMAAIWPWAGASPWPADWPRQAWLSEGFFALRTVALLVLWSVLAMLATRRRPAVAAAGLVLWALSGALAGFDWQMSLEPPFRSTVFGLLFLENQTLTGLSFVVLAAFLLPGPQPRPGPLAALLLAVVLLWSYLAFVQYLIVWSGNLPHETLFYRHRLALPWPTVLWVVAALLGVLAFLALLPGHVRHNRVRLAWVAGMVLAGRLIETAWLVLPAWPGEGLLLAYGAALAALGGIWLAVFRFLLQRREVAHART